MDGFKNSTKTQYMKGGACEGAPKGGSCEGYAKGGSVKGAAKIAKVMGEFKRGELHSGSKKGAEVKNPKQAVAIALSEARNAGAKVPIKKAAGGDIVVTANKPSQPAVLTTNYRMAGSNTAGAGGAGRTSSSPSQRLTPLTEPAAKTSSRNATVSPAVVSQPQSTLGSIVGARTPTGYGASGTFHFAKGGKADAAAKKDTKPIKRDRGGEATMADLNRANRDVGGMSKAAVEAAGRAIASGNRIAVEEGNESRLVGRKATPRSREVTVQNSRLYSRAEPAAPMGDLERRLNTLPSQRGEMRRGPAGAGFSVEPMVSAVRNALGLKKGGLAAMPRGKKC